jgi:hypothetical protein
VFGRNEAQRLEDAINEVKDDSITSDRLILERVEALEQKLERFRIGAKLLAEAGLASAHRVEDVIQAGLTLENRVAELERDQKELTSAVTSDIEDLAGFAFEQTGLNPFNPNDRDAGGVGAETEQPVTQVDVLIEEVEKKARTIRELQDALAKERANNPVPTWTDSKGRTHRIIEMPTPYLVNVLDLIDGTFGRQGRGSGLSKVIRDELQRRADESRTYCYGCGDFHD